MKGHKTKQISIDDIQFYAAHSAELHPLLYIQFLDEIISLERKHKLCALPMTIFEHYHVHLAQKIRKVA